MGLKKLIFALIALGCGGQDTGNNKQDGSPDSQVTYSDGNRDSGLDGNHKDSNEGNNPPVVQFDPNMSRNARAGAAKNLAAIASDPDNDPVNCNWNFGDNSPETGYGSCTSSHIFNSPGEYSVSVTAKDNKGLEASVNDIFTAYLNIPPHVILDCPEIDPVDGLCVYRTQPWYDICIDGSGSYDEDGEIDRYRIQGDINGVLTVTNENPIKCTAYSSTGTVIGVFSVKDNEELWSAVNFKSVIE